MRLRVVMAVVVMASFLATCIVPSVAAAAAFSSRKPASGSSSTVTTPKLSVYITDRHGIKGSSSFVMTIDGKTVKPKITYKSRYKKVTVSFQLTKALGVGSHTVYVKVKNVRRKTYKTSWKFVVLAPPPPPPPPAPDPMPVTIAANACGACHAGYRAAHSMDQCELCHGEGRPLGSPAYGPGDLSGHTLSCALEIPCHGGGGAFPHVLGSDCGVCHSGSFAGIGAGHALVTEEPTHESGSTRCTASGCHLTSLTLEHYRRSIDGVKLSCATCHASTSVPVVAALRAGSTACENCHVLTPEHALDVATHTAFGACSLSGCHSTSAVAIHGAVDGPGCGACHGASRTPSLVCTSCHPEDINQAHALAAIVHAAPSGSCVTAMCHVADVTLIHGRAGGPGCAACHAPGRALTAECVTCHQGALEVIHPRIGAAHTAPGDGCVSALCHASDVTALHGGPAGPGCGACHEAGSASTIACANCHPGDLTATHAFASTDHTAAASSCVSAACHAADVAALHAAGPGCAACHGPGKVPSTWCAPCHSADVTAVHPHVAIAHTAPASSCVSSPCHAGAAAALHSRLPAGGCPTCHVAGRMPTLDCGSCHGADVVSLHTGADPSHTASPGTCTQAGCHTATGAAIHRALPGSGCSTCHAPGTTPSLQCTTCHASDLTGRHLFATADHAAPVSSCVVAGCHAGNASSVHGAGGGPGCAACHAPGKTPSLQCSACHAGNVATLHAGADAAHTAARSTCVQPACHATDAAALHGAAGGPGCAACHAAGVVASIACADCHSGDLTPRHPSGGAGHTAPTSSCVTAGCHAANAASMHDAAGGPGCAACHAPGVTPTLTCATCHPGNMTTLHASAATDHASPRSTCVQPGCHAADAAALHGAVGGPGCAACHAADVAPSVTCVGCHAGDLTDRHASAALAHTAPAGTCVSATCHGTDVAATHATGLGCVDCHGAGATASRTCGACHGSDLVTLHPVAASAHRTSAATCVQSGCHANDAARIHGEPGGPGCLACHAAGRTPTLVCATCHPQGFTAAHPSPLASHTAPAGACVTGGCHGSAAAALHGAVGGPGCVACHAAGRTPTLVCSACHTTDALSVHPGMSTAHTAATGSCVKDGCHLSDAAAIHSVTGGPGCAACHSLGSTPTLTCSACHISDLVALHPGSAEAHVASAGACAQPGCHTADAAGTHTAPGGPGCAACHHTGVAATVTCAACHAGDINTVHPDAAASHTAPAGTCVRSVCHPGDMTVVHGKWHGPGCAACHAQGVTPSLRCADCHAGDASTIHPLTGPPHIAATGACVQTGCHVSNIVTLHGSGPMCAACHATGVVPTAQCSACHAADAAAVHAPLVGGRHTAPQGACATNGCHASDVAVLHGVAGGPGCAACHATGKVPSLECGVCHLGGFEPTHPVPEAAHTVPAGVQCSGCHATNVATIHGATGGPNCAACHAAGGSPSTACSECHSRSEVAALHPTAALPHTASVHPCTATGDCHGRNSAAIHAGSPAGCATCHETGPAQTNNCNVCHDYNWAKYHASGSALFDYHSSKVGTGYTDWGYSSEGWLLAPYARGQSMKCTVCHDLAGTPNVWNFPAVVNGAPVSVTTGTEYPNLCRACHGGTLTQWHAGCYDCHSGGHGSGSPLVFEGRDCSACHSHGGYGWPHGPGWMGGSTL